MDLIYLGRRYALTRFTINVVMTLCCMLWPVIHDAPASEPFADLLAGCQWLNTDAAYRGEVFTNTRGGRDTNDATQYTGRFDLLFTADLNAFEYSPGGVFVLHFQQLHGEGITDQFVGARQRLSNIDGNPGAGYNLSQASQYWWQRGFVDDFVTVKIGKILADTEFAVTTLAGDFINTSFGWTQTVPQAAYPNPTAGLVTFFQLTDQLGFKAGVFDGQPDGGNWGFSGSGDALAILEARRYHTLGQNLNGDVHFGMWYHNGDFTDQTGETDREGNHGLFTGVSQELYREPGADSDGLQGLGAFMQYGWRPEDRNRMHQYWGLGLAYRGLLAGRDADSCGIGVGNMRFSGDLPVGLDDETVVELFYKARFRDRVSIQPDLQYFSDTGGQFRDALAFGLRFEVLM